MRWNRGDSEALQILESQVRKVKVKGSEEEITEYRFKDPRELALRCMAEIRGQLNLQLDIFKTLYDVEAIAEFQKEVLSAIEEVSPDVRNTIINVSRKERLFEDLLQSIDQRFTDATGAVPSLADWAVNTPIILDGRPFTFERHEYLIEPYQDDHPYQVEDKAAQLGLNFQGHARGNIQGMLLLLTRVFSICFHQRQTLVILLGGVSTLSSKTILIP